MPTRGRKGSPGSLRGAAALVRRLERQLGCTVTEARIAPLRAVDTAVVTVPDAAAPAGRLRVLAAGVPTPGGAGVCVGAPLSLGEPALRRHRRAAARQGPMARVVAVVPAGLRYDEAAARLRALLAAGTRIGAVLVAGDEGVLVANRLPRDAASSLPSSTRSTRPRRPRAGCWRSRCARPGTRCGCWPTRWRSAPGSAWPRARPPTRSR